MKSHLGIIEPGQSISPDRKEKILVNAEFWADRAEIIERFLYPTRETSEAQDYLKSKEKELS
jgi:hypothetical protein